jgi:hypothetical protein
LVYAFRGAADEIQQERIFSFVTASADRMKVNWLAISCDLLTAEESAELSALLTNF